MTMKQFWKRYFEAKFKAYVSDGPNTISSEARLVHVYAKNDWLREAVTLRIDAITMDDFWDPAVFDRLR